MSIVWTLVATFLYSEIALVILLLLPIISCTRWRSVFHSRLTAAFSQYWSYFFVIMVALLTVLFADAAREIRQYTRVNTETNLQMAPGAVEHHHMKLFRAQRNCYISGFALFLWFVLRRLMKLILSVASLQAESEAAMRQAEGATKAAQAMLDDADKKKSESDLTETIENGANRIQELEERLNGSQLELAKAKTNLEAMKQQAESTNREYDRLSEECQKLQQRLQVQGDGDSKKTE